MKLLEAFHASVQLFQARPSTTASELSRRIRNHMRAEKDLVIDPKLFSGLRSLIPEISCICVQLKPGRLSNEITQFKYDVILYVGHLPPENRFSIVLDWERDKLTADAIGKLVREGALESVHITGVPNSRVSSEVRLVRLLAGPTPPASAGELKRAISVMADRKAVDPNALWDLERDSPYQVGVTWTATDSEDRYDVLITRAGFGPLEMGAGGRSSSRSALALDLCEPAFD